MGLISSIKIAKRALTRRKTKNFSAILAIALGVTLMVGIQITTDTLENAFLTSLLIREGEVDIRFSNGTGGFLSSSDEANISALVPDALAIMPELKSGGPAMIGSQFEPSVSMAGIPLDYNKNFGEFYDWDTGEVMDISSYLVDNTSVLLSSSLAEDMDINKSTELPLNVTTEFTSINVEMMINESTGLPILNETTMLPIFILRVAEVRVNLTIQEIFDSRRPGIGASYRGVLFSLEGYQDWMSLQDPLRNKDIISAYLITYQTDHFVTPIDETLLQEKFDALEEILPVKMINDQELNVYAIDSARLLYAGLLDLIFNLMSSFLNVLGLLIIITGILLITNVQLMSVEDREFQTGVLRAVGEKRGGIFRSMLFETLFQGVFGGIFGLVGGLIFGQIVALYLVSLFGSGSASVQPLVKESVVVFSVIIGVILGILTGLLPALRASRVNIVEALRGIKITFEEKSGRNLVIVGILLSLLGIFFLLNNGILNEELDYIWLTTGWDNILEWENILLGAGFLFSGFGIILSRYISRTKAFNLTAIVLWGTPVFMFVVAMGDGWITDMSGSSLNILIFAIIEVVIGSVMLVGMNLPSIMRILRNTLIRIRGVKGVAQVAPALISSHKTRSTLTFAIFAVVLTLNVTVASLVATNIDSTIGQSEEDSRGIDLYVQLSDTEYDLPNTSYTEELYKLDLRITDIIGMKTFTPGSTDYTRYIATKDPFSPDFNPQKNLLPLSFGELRSDQIRGDAQNASDENRRFDFYMYNLPDGVRPASIDLGADDEELLDQSKRAWDVFFDPEYTMTAYNITFDLENFDISTMGGFTASTLKDVDPILDINGTEVQYPIVFTDSFILPLGMPIWIPFNTSQYGFPNYQPFTIGGSFDSERAGGWPLARNMQTEGFSSGSFSSTLGTVYFPERFSNYTNFFGMADALSPDKRTSDQ
ncbi:MAG: FtsX-like permease family protein, partial [Candidatus Hodarchaeales archaeon]